MMRLFELDKIILQIQKEDKPRRKETGNDEMCLQLVGVFMVVTVPRSFTWVIMFGLN